MEITARPRRRGWLRVLRVTLAAACVACVLLLVPAALGYGTHVVGDDAMAGGFAQGSLVLDEQLSPGRLVVGDVVTVTPPGGDDPVVRRVAAISDAGVRTRGDTTGPDPWVVSEEATARVALSVPAVGWPLLAVDSVSVPPWVLVALALGLAGVLMGLRRAQRREPSADDPAPAVVPEAVGAAPPVPPAG